MAQGGSEIINAQTMKIIIKERGLNPPMGASPGEMRLWMKKNGLLEALSEQRDQRAAPAAPRAPPAPRPQPVASAPKKTAGRRGGRVGRSGSVEAALKEAQATQQQQQPAYDAGAAQVYGDALDDFKKQAAYLPVHAGAFAGMPGTGGAAANAMPASDPQAYARLFQMQVMQQQMALMQQQQWHRQAGQQRAMAYGAVPSQYNWAAGGAAAMPAAYYYQQPQTFQAYGEAYNQQPQAFQAYGEA